MRLLVVAFTGSVHAARYLQLLEGSGWEVHVFDPLIHARPHPELPPVTLHTAPRCDEPPPGVRLVRGSEQEGIGFAGRAAHLGRLLDELAPDLLHTHEIQHSAAVADRVRRDRGGLPVPWLVTNWGSDLFWFGRSASHRPLIRSVLSGCDHYGAECHRDVALARAFGLRGDVVGVWPVTGGLDIDQAAALRAPGPVSARRTLVVKGVGAQTPWGRAEVALDAVGRCADLLDGWELCSYQLDDALETPFAAAAEQAGMRYTQLSTHAARESAHDALLAMHGRARVSLALNRSDGLSTSFLEALAMGSFPVQSDGSCGRELTPHGRGALFVDRDADAATIAAALRRALTDDALVDGAAELNAQVAAVHLDRRRVRPRILDMYERIVTRAWLEAA